MLQDGSFGDASRSNLASHTSFRLLIGSGQGVLRLGEPWTCQGLNWSPLNTSCCVDSGQSSRQTAFSLVTLRGTIPVVNRTSTVIHENLRHISLFFLSMFGPLYYGPPKEHTCCLFIDGPIRLFSLAGKVLLKILRVPPFVTTARAEALLPEEQQQ